MLLSPLAALRSHARMSGLSDAVGGVHGGKYQFGPRGDAGFVGGAFADSLAASDSLSAGVQAGSSELWPTWATMSSAATTQFRCCRFRAVAMRGCG